MSVEIAPGEVLGLAGPSGAGKSTLLDLLLGWRRPDRGTVSVDGVDLAAVDRDEWLRRVAWVPQRPVLVAGTVADNLRLGAPDATGEQVAAAAAAAALDLPLDTPVHEHGTGLSTGQQRRVALGRALLADRPLLLLDEPTEGVDADTEAALLATLPDALAGRTAVVVSHRPAVLGLCHRVVTLPHRGGPEPEAGRAAPPITAAAVGPDPAPDADPPTSDAGRGGAGSLLAALRPHRGRLALAVLAGSGALGCTVALTATSAWLISAAALHPPVLALMVAIVAVRTFGLAKGVLRYAERLASHDVALRMLATLRVRLWESLVRLGPAVTGRLRSGELLARLVGDVDAQQDVVVRALVPAASAAVVGIGTAVVFGALLPGAGLALAAGLVCAGVVAPAVTVRLARRAARRTAAARGAVVGGVVELLDGLADMLAFGNAAGRRRAVAELDAGLTALQRRSATATGLGVALTVLAVGGATVACTALGIVALRDGRAARHGAGGAGPDPARLRRTRRSASRRRGPDVDGPARGAPADRAGTGARGGVRTRPPADRPGRPHAGGACAHRALAGRRPTTPSPAVDLVAAAGKRLVLTGPTGSGKSTVLAALMRTLDPRAGAVLIDDVDARDVRSDDVRARIAWCGPSTHLFDSTLRQNLQLARPGAADGELVDALRRAGLRSWLDGLPAGLGTQVGRHGGEVSGGERQRIGLARALLADRPVLLLDEPTAHLDAGTAARVCADLLRVDDGTHRARRDPPSRGAARVAAGAPARAPGDGIGGRAGPGWCRPCDAHGEGGEPVIFVEPNTG